MASIDQIESSVSILSSQPISDPSILPSLPRKRNTGRPITTHGNEWLTVPTKLEAAQLECPFIKIADVDWDSAHGVSHNLDPELDEVTRLQRILIPNKPVQRPTRVLPSQKTPDRLPRPGHCSDLFAREDSEYFEFDHVTHGEWVRARSIQCKGNKRSRDSKWRLTPTQIVAEIIFYFETVAKDLIAAREWKKRHGKGRFKPKAKLWILPQVSTRISSKRTTPSPHLRIPNRVPHGVTGSICRLGTGHYMANRAFLRSCSSRQSQHTNPSARLLDNCGQSLGHPSNHQMVQRIRLRGCSHHARPARGRRFSPVQRQSIHSFCGPSSRPLRETRYSPRNNLRRSKIRITFATVNGTAHAASKIRFQKRGKNMERRKD